MDFRSFFYLFCLCFSKECYHYYTYHFIYSYHQVDGIYPELARFVKSISVPIGQMQQWFSLWQEVARKDVECAFRIFSAKV